MVSIAMSYRNRKLLFQRTLESIYRTASKNFEIVIVDDGSIDSERIEDICGRQKNIKLIRIDPETKTWLNPCIPYNMAFKECSGDVIIIQNPECYHAGDIVGVAEETVTGSNYITFPVYSLNEEETKIFNDNNLHEIIKPTPPSFDGDSGWYNHGQYNPRGLHFCSAIKKSSLKLLNGFDERFKDGFSYEDNEFINRIRIHGFNVVFLNEPIVLHQWHYSESIHNNPNCGELVHKNSLLFESILTGKTKMWR